MWKSLKYAGAASVWNKGRFIKPSKAKLSGTVAEQVCTGTPTGCQSTVSRPHLPPATCGETIPRGRNYYSTCVWLTRSSSFRGINVFVVKSKLHVHLPAPAGGCSRQDMEQLLSPQTQQRRVARSPAASPQTLICINKKWWIISWRDREQPGRGPLIHRLFN